MSPDPFDGIDPATCTPTCSAGVGMCEQLCAALRGHAEDLADLRSSKESYGQVRTSRYIAEKPHGRHAVTIHFGGSAGMIDLSIMPRCPNTKKPEPKPEV